MARLKTGTSQCKLTALDAEPFRPPEKVTKLLGLLAGILGWLAVSSSAQTNSFLTASNQIPAGAWFREVDGTIYDVQQNAFWHPASGKVLSVEKGGLVISCAPGQLFFVRNYPAAPKPAVAEGDAVNFSAMQTGTTNAYGERLLQVLDCGTAPSPQALEKLKARLQEELAMNEKIRNDIKKVRQAKIAAQEAKTVGWLQAQATNGSASAQCSLGLHLLNGQGCETNRELAVYWLQKACAQGSFEATNILAQLKP